MLDKLPIKLLYRSNLWRHHPYIRSVGGYKQYENKSHHQLQALEFWSLELIYSGPTHVNYSILWFAKVDTTIHFIRPRKWLQSCCNYSCTKHQINYKNLQYPLYRKPGKNMFSQKGYAAYINHRELLYSLIYEISNFIISSTRRGNWNFQGIDIPSHE